MSKQKVIVLGGGIGGLSAAYFLAKSGKYNVTVLEKGDTIGGLCGSFEHDGFVLDYGAHKLYSTIPGIMDFILNLMGSGRLIKISKKNSIFFHGSLLDYPLKLSNLAKVLGPATFLKLGFGYAASLLPKFSSGATPRSYEDYMIKSFGRNAYELVFRPMADKVWGRPSELHVQMARARFPTANGLDAILKLVGIKKETADTNAAFFYYPRRGFGDMAQKLREEIESSGSCVITDASVGAAKTEGKKITSISAVVKERSTSFGCDYLISSIPIADLGGLIFHGSNEIFEGAVNALGHRHLVMVYLFIKKPMILKDQWIFFPEKKFIFSRIFEQKQMNPELGPKDRTCICCDFTCDEDDRLWHSDDSSLSKKCIEGMRQAGFIKPDEVTGSVIRRAQNFYPRYDLRYKEKIKAVSAPLKEIENLLLTGRIGMYNYNNADHCIDMGHFIAEKLCQGLPSREIWDGLEERVDGYRIVD